MGQLVMRSYYVDSEVEQKLDQHAWKNNASKADYVRIALTFGTKILEKSGGNMSPEKFQLELDKILEENLLNNK